MSRVAIIDYGSGNLHSALKAVERAARDVDSGHRVVLATEPEAVRSADRIILPGVGAFADCRAGLMAVDGLYDAVQERVLTDGRPFLGICVGMQLMATTGEEHGTTPGFGWIDGVVRHITPDDPALKVPHMGWNTLSVNGDHAVLDGIKTGDDGWHAYFVHSYHFVAERSEDVLATTSYGGPVTAMVARDNMVGTQFHPEKSQRLGLKMLANFVRWSP